MSKINTEIVIVKIPRDPNLTCQLTHYTTLVHERKGGKILVDYPVGLNRREKRWIRENSRVIKIST